MLVPAVRFVSEYCVPVPDVAAVPVVAVVVAVAAVSEGLVFKLLAVDVEEMSS